MTQELAGRHALVTGGGRGIGAAIACALSEQGARVTLLARTAAQLAETAAGLPGESNTVIADVTDAQQVEGAFAKVRERWGEIQILVNNAGKAVSRALAKSDTEFWQQVLAVNLSSVHYCTRAVLPTCSVTVRAGSSDPSAWRRITVNVPVGRLRNW